MLVRRGGHTDLAAPAKAEPADDVVWRDYYTRRPQIRLSGEATKDAARPEPASEVMLDGNDVARLVECAVRHPNVNMRNGVLAAIWNHPDSFRQIFRFGLGAPVAFAEIRRIVAEELEKSSPKPESPAINPLLPRMPRPAHLKAKGRSE